jgi:glucose/arabinose dehydrogenase
MGDDIPPEELNRAPQAGLNFGFPWSGGGHTRTNEYKDETPPEGLVFPEIETPAHAADLGMIFYTGTNFPAKYRGGFFRPAGSWDRTVPIGARVSFASLKPDGTGDKAEVFAEGWLNEKSAYEGRPVDVAQLPDGSLIVSDDFAGPCTGSLTKGTGDPNTPGRRGQRYSPARRIHKGPEGCRAIHRRGAKVRNGSPRPETGSV